MLEADARERIMVALDCDRERALELGDLLSGRARWVKIGMTLFYAEGPAIVRAFKERGFKVFLDLKFHDIPHQVKGAARSAALTGADLLTVHGLGAGDMLAAACEGAREAAEATGAERARVIAITVLTSMNTEALASIDEAEYRATLLDLLRGKLKSTKYKDGRDLYAKLSRFAASRGFEGATTYACLRDLVNSTTDEPDDAALE